MTKIIASPALWRTGMLIIVGVMCGIMMMTSLLRPYPTESIAAHAWPVRALWLGFSVLGAAALIELRKRICAFAGRLPLNDATRLRYFRYEILTYAIFLGYGFVLAGIKSNVAFGLLLLVLFALAQLWLLWGAADRAQKNRWFDSVDALPLLFFISGFAALIYQVVWQRVLFATFGVNIESVTVIVSVFMFGLGVGALLGGQVQKYFPHRLLECFIGIEIAIGLFGLCSIGLINAAGALVPHNTLLSLIVLSYALLAFPTMMMGATLPLLVGHLQAYFSNLGSLVSKLYAYNTFGSALAAFLTVMLLFVVGGQQSTLVIAALCNGVTALFVWRLRARLRTREVALPVAEKRPVEGRIPYALALVLSVVVGYASLSFEILWFRVIGFMTASKPQVFGTLLAVFLAGIASGSLRARRFSESGQDARDYIYRALLKMVVIMYLSAPLVAHVSLMVEPQMGIFFGYLIVWMLAYVSGGIFPLLCHMSITMSDEKRAGMGVAWMYFVNIIGATLGSLVTGFILLEMFALAWNMVIVSVVVMGMLALFVFSTRWQGRPSAAACAMGTGVAVVALLLQPLLYERMIEKFQGKGPLKYVNETRSGIITVAAAPDGDFIFGNGAYDGRFNIDPLVESNKIDRAYMAMALHPHPKRVLEMGLSGGSWGRVLTMYKPLKELVSIEINPGYIEMIKHYPDISPLLQHPKWTHYIDDGRRWLSHRPDERFDMIIMNTTYYWRSNATNLLSREFLTLCKQHLNPGGVIFYNHTGATDSLYTAAHVFKHVALFKNMVIASDSPFDLPVEKRKEHLLSFVHDNGSPVFAPDAPHQALLRHLAHAPLDDVSEQVRAQKNLWLITDDNMAAEYKIDDAFIPAYMY